MKICAIADLHGKFWKIKIPVTDVLVVAGDLDAYQYQSELEDFNKWLSKVPCKYKIVIAGNHDGFIDRTPICGVREILNNGIYLENSGCEIKGVKFWGAPYTNVFGKWFFMLPEPMLTEEWNKIPIDTDILITHGPPDGILDFTQIGQENVGSVSLRERIKKIKPKLHIFGHIHEGYGTKVKDGTTYINCSVMDLNYSLENKPIVINFDEKTKEILEFYPVE